jgi:predicted nucleic acid-binding protein
VARLVVDSGVLIDHLRGHPQAGDLLRSKTTHGHELWSITVVRTEVLTGARPHEEAAALELLDRLQWLDVTVELADTAGRLARQFRRSHPGIDTADYLIAAGAQLLDAELLTRNVRHFPMFTGLEPPYGETS